jgi:hypothetical protein
MYSRDFHHAFFTTMVPRRKEGQWHRVYLVLQGARKWRPHRLCVKMFECEFKLLDQRSTFNDDLSIYSTFLLVNFSIAGHMVEMWLNSRDFVVKAQVMHSWHSKVRPVSPRISSMYSKNTLPISNSPDIAKTIMGNSLTRNLAN